MIKVGAVVEWDPEYASGTMRGTVTRVELGRVYLRIRRHPTTRNPNPQSNDEVWFDPHEVERLRVVEP